MPKITAEKLALPTLWIDTALGIKLAKAQAGEPIQELEKTRVAALKELVVERVRACRLLCPQGEQEFEYRGKRLDDNISEEFALLSRGIWMLPHHAIRNSHAFVAMEAYVKRAEEVRLLPNLYFYSDPVEELQKNRKQKFFVSTSGLPKVLLEMSDKARRGLHAYFEELRQENVAKNRTYEQQFLLERKAFPRAMGDAYRSFQTKFLTRNLDLMDVLAWQGHDQYFHRWQRLTGKSRDWEGLGDFLMSDYFCELPLGKIASQLYAKLMTGNGAIEPGDSMDVNHLSACIPLAHFVLTDRKMANRIKELGIDTEWGCAVFSESTIESLFAELEKI